MGIPDTVAQAGAAAAEVMPLVDRAFVELEPNTAFVNEELCSGCRICVGLCPYNAISFDTSSKTARFNEILCKGCGSCVAACPSGAIEQHLFKTTQILSELEGVLRYV
jgi:heterodisulfide reductase subunit A